MLRKLYIETYFEELGLPAGVEVECQGTHAYVLYEPVSNQLPCKTLKPRWKTARRGAS